MKKKSLENNINNIFNNLISSDFSKVSYKIKNNEGVILNMENKKQFYKIGGFGLVLAAILMFIGFITFNANKTLATIGIDVNPSLELVINSKNKVTDVIANNEDAKKVIDNMNLKKTDVNVAVNAIMGSMLKNGYISDKENSVLISLVDGKYDISKLAKEVYNFLEKEKINPSILLEETNVTDYDKELAKKYNISVSKVKLINEIINNNSLYKFADLVNLNTNDLNILLNKNNDSVSVIGKVNSGKYITLDEAKSIVFKNVNAKEDSIFNLDIEFDYDDGIMVYDIEFDYNDKEYDYEINAISGEIIKSKIENKKGEITGYIGTAKALNIAKSYAKVSGVKNVDVDFEFKSGSPVYEVKFETNTHEYEYIIDAKNGSILYDKVMDKNINSSNYIGVSKAKSIALNHAKITAYDNFEIELDDEDGIIVYEISFDVNDLEYEYKIDAKTGRIISSEVDND